MRVTKPACVVLALGLSTTTGCDKGPKPKEMTVDELAALMSGDPAPTIFDVNGDSTRKEYGVIPGAVLLEGSRDYAMDLLPASKATSLVFYCASTWCGASETAAKRALQGGYTAVAVLPAGIKGWVGAGQPTEPN